MLIAILDLEREPLEFDLTIPSGTIDYGNEIRQIDGLTASGTASLITEHRAPRQQIQDIRLQAEFGGRFEVHCARCLDPVEHAIEEQFDLLFRPLGADAGAVRTRDLDLGDGNRVLSRRRSCPRRRAAGTGVAFPSRQNALPPRLQRSLLWLRAQSEFGILHLRHGPAGPAMDGFGRHTRPDEKLEFEHARPSAAVSWQSPMVRTEQPRERMKGICHAQS